MFALAAREWIVADSEAQLDEYIPVFDSQEYRDHVARDIPRMERPTHLTQGYTMRPD